MAKSTSFEQAKKNLDKKKNSLLSASPWAIALAVLIIIAMVATDFGSNQRAVESIVVGSYRGKKVEFLQGSRMDNEAKESIQRYISQMSSYMGDEFQFDINEPSSQDLAQTYYRRAFENQLIRSAVEVKAQENKLEPSDHRIREALKRDPRFQINGRFSETEYNRTNPETIVRMMNEIESQLALSAVTVPLFQGQDFNPSLISLIQDQASRQRSIEYISFSQEDFPQAQVLAFGQENSELFKNFEIAQITITTSLSDAQEVREEILQGDKTFGEIAKERSEDSFNLQEGFLGRRYASAIQGEFRNEEDLSTLLALGENEISPVFETFNGFVIYKMISPAVEANFEDADVLRRVRNFIRTNRRDLFQDTLMALAQEKANGPWTQGALGKPVKESGFFALNIGGFGSIPSLSQAANNDSVLSSLSDENFYKEVFQGNPGQVLSPILAPGDNVILARIKEERVIPEALEEAQILEDLSFQRQSSYTLSVLESPDTVDNFDQNWDRILNEALEPAN